MNKEVNPLQQFYRTEKMYVKLPSGGNFYEKDIIDLTDDGEVGIRSMTAADEVLFKNPDALLNGKAIKDVIKSCVPSVKDVDKLLTNDIDTLVVAIRHASFGDELDIISECPECEKENTFALSMENTLSRTDYLDDSYPVNLNNGLTAFIRPYNFENSMISIKKSFEQNNAIKNIENPGFNEEQKLKLLGDSVDVLSELNFKLVAKCVMRIIKEGESEEDSIDVTNQKHINDFIKNINRNDVKKIQDELERINNIGIKKDFNATCEHCGHKWDVPIDFNPATFFIESL